MSGFSELVPMEVMRPKGRVRVELLDDRGKVKHRSEGENFISILWDITAKSWQRNIWSQFAFNAQLGAESNNNGWTGWHPIMFPNSHLACWNDTSATNPTTETRVRTDEKGIVAYASRAPSGAASGRRGVVNVTDSIQTPRGESITFDWPTSSGNGTFQSVGYTSILPGSAETDGRLLCRPTPINRRYYRVGGTMTEFMNSRIYSGDCSTKDLDGNLVIPYHNGANLTLTIISVPALVDGVFDEMGARVGTFDYSHLVVTGWPSIGNGQVPTFIGEYAGHYYLVGGSTTPRLIKINKSTGAYVGFVTLPSPFTGANSGIIIGSNAYVSWGNANAANTVLRYDLTGASPSLTATITLDGPRSIQCHQLASDGENLFVYDGATNSSMRGIHLFNTSGNYLQDFGTFSSGVRENTAPPYAATNTTIAGLTIFNNMWNLRKGDQDTGVQSPNSVFPTYPTEGNLGYWTPFPIFADNSIGWLVYHGGELCSVQVGGRSGTSVTLAIMGLGYNLGSRILLDSPVTKTSSNTMKITYDISFPSMYPS